LVTGGASGIGAVIASAFREAGSRVHICDVDRAALGSKKGWNFRQKAGQVIDAIVTE
jgi:NAD(P)-dependent dehydrogenase (short-subunit alcohol dehydrogenase family)